MKDLTPLTCPQVVVCFEFFYYVKSKGSNFLVNLKILVENYIRESYDHEKIEDRPATETITR